MGALFAVLALLVPARAHAWESDLRIPPAQEPVTDEVGLLDAGEAARLNARLRDLKQRSGVEIAVYVAQSLQGRDIADFSIAVAEKWGLGRKKTDKGLLFVIAPRERKMRFEVGYGLEGDITDAFSRRVLDEEVRPRFRSGQYAAGIAAAVSRVVKKAGVEEAGDGESLLQARVEGIPLWVWLLLAVVVLGFQAVYFVLRLLGVVPPARVIRRGGWSHHGGWGGGGGGFGGWGGGGGGFGGWGGGGGGFGGGGASSDW